MKTAYLSVAALLLLGLGGCDPVNQEVDLRNSSASLSGAQGSSAHGREGSGDEGEARNARKSRDVAARRTPRPSDDEGGSDLARAPARYSVKLNTTKGEVIIDVTRAWSPNGADRFHELVKAGYFDGCAFFRVLDGFMAQTGINGDPAVSAQWRNKRITDDPPADQSNTRGMVSFAMAGPNSRTTQFFINYGDNRRLDGMGFTPFGRVRDMDAVDDFYSGYGEGAPRGRGPAQGRLQSEGNAYLKQHFPNLDYIESATIVR